MADVRIEHREEDHRYVALKGDEEVGVLDYQDASGARTFTHTGVPKQHEGQGIAGKLVQQALDDVRQVDDLKVVPVCPYVATWIKRHPAYEDLLSM